MSDQLLSLFTSVCRCSSVIMTCSNTLRIDGSMLLHRAVSLLQVQINAHHLHRVHRVVWPLSSCDNNHQNRLKLCVLVTSGIVTA